MDLLAELRCKACGRTYNNRKSFLRHVREKHPTPGRQGSYELKCDFCNYKCQRGRDLRRHMERCKSKPVEPAATTKATTSPGTSHASAVTVSATSTKPKLVTETYYTGPDGGQHQTITNQTSACTATTTTAVPLMTVTFPTNSDSTPTEPNHKITICDQRQETTSTTGTATTTPTPTTSSTNMTLLQNFESTTTPSVTDLDFLDHDDLIQDTPPTSEIGKFCLNTQRLARLLGEERLRRVNLEQYRSGVVFIRTMEQCRLPDGTKVNYTEERTYHPPAESYYREIGL